MTAFLHQDAIMHEWSVPNECDGLRADHYLSMRIGRLSRNRAKNIILAGDFRRRDSQLKPSQQVRAGEIVQLWRFPPDEDELDPNSVGIIFEDANWLVVDKAPNLAIHPTARYLHNTLTGWLKKYAPLTPIHPCHRIDRETSGIVVCAKNPQAESALKSAFQRGDVIKTYLAIVRGQMKNPVDIDVPLSLQGEHGLVKIRMVAGRTDGLPSQTLVKPLYFDIETNRTLVECEPKSGRQHQIRAHLAHVGFPIVGDKLYAMGDEFFDAFTRRKERGDVPELEHQRHALHAYRIAFEFEGQLLRFVAPFPSDLSSLLPLGAQDAH